MATVHKVQSSTHCSVADPGLSIGDGNLSCRHFSVKTHAKTRIGSHWGCALVAPPGFANVVNKSLPSSQGPHISFHSICMIAYLHASCVTRINVDKHTYLCILSGRKNVINMLSYSHVSCVTRINLDKHRYLCILSGRKNVINMVSYSYVSCVTSINLDKHINMSHTESDACSSSHVPDSVSLQT